MDDVRVVVVDDHPVVREGFAAAFARSGRFRVVGTGGSFEDAIQLADRLRPDILTVDVEMPGPLPTDALRAIRVRHQGVRIAVISMHSGSPLTRKLAEAGADIVLPKSTPTSEILDRLESIVHDRSSRPTVPAPSSCSLTARETDVIRLVAEGHANREIASLLHISEGTVRRHLANAYEKLGVHSRTQGVRAASLLGYL